jgi:diaminopimelate decarboxylase
VPSPALTAAVAGAAPALPDVMLRAPTPAYVYDLAEVRRNARALTAALPDGARICYSLKANPHPLLQTALRAEGAWAEVCSRGELESALGAGFDPAQVLYTGPGKRNADVRHALRRSVREFSVDSPHGLAQLDRLAAEADTSVRCLLRINDEQPARGQGLAMTGVPSQFGADTGWVLAAPEQFAGTPRARVTGLHLYMGTNITAVEDLLDQFERALTTARAVGAALAPHGVEINTLDLGGGFGAPFARPGARLDLAGLRAGLCALLDLHAAGWRENRPQLIFESGRYLVGTAGTLLIRVLDTKCSHGRQIAVVESGINHLGGMSGMRRVPPLLPHPVAPAPADGVAATVPTLLTGPLCTPLDVWDRSADLPPLSPGQLLAVPNVGAYGLTASLIGFLGHPLPVEIVLDPDLGPSEVVDVSRIQLARVPVRLPDPSLAH